MAIIDRPNVGRLRGKYGNSVIQRRFGKDVVSLRPDHYKPTESKKLIEVRKEFAVKVLYAKALKQNKLLIQCWKNCTLKSISGYHKALSYNSKYILNEVPTKECTITPPDLYYPDENKSKFLTSKYCFSGNGISFDYKIDILQPLNPEDRTNFDIPYVGIVFLVLIYSDGKADRISTIMIQQDVEIEEKDSDGYRKIEFKFTDEEKEMVEKYRLLRGYFAFVKPHTTNPKKTDWTSTNFIEVNLNDYYKDYKQGKETK